MRREPGINDFAQRTTQGVEAAADGVRKALSQPDRAAYLAVAELASWARLFGWRRASLVLEPAILPLLVGTVARSRISGDRKARLSVALASGAAGAFEQARVPARPTVAGIAGVAGNQIGYAARLVDKRARVKAPAAAAAGAVLAAGVGLTAWRNRALLPATLVGGAAAVTTAALADDARFRRRSTAEAGVGHGANLVLIGEGMRVVRHTLLRGRTGIGARFVEALTLGTTSVGHMLLVDALTER